MSADREMYEGLIPGEGKPRWNQSWYYQAYDADTRTGCFIRLGFLETENEANSWLIVFREGRPIFTRTNLNLPYTKDRPKGGVTLAGMRVDAEVPLTKTRITVESPDFSMNLVWQELAPLEDAVALTHDAVHSFAKEIASIHLEGTSTVTGEMRHRGVASKFNGSGFRDVAAGIRNWDGLEHYRLAWPVFENGMAFAGVIGHSTTGQRAGFRMMYDGNDWKRVSEIEDRMGYDAEGFAATDAEWTFRGDDGKDWTMTGRPLFRWLYPLDTFVVCEQLFEFRLEDGTIGHGLYETGYRLPWEPKRR